MKPRGLEAYVLAIERHLGTPRGREHVLSPRDFALARAWHAAGMPLAAVLSGIDRAAERGAGVASLLACRRAVEALAAAAPPDPDALPPEDLLPRLEALRGALAAAGRPMAFEQAARRAAELIDLAAVAREPNWDYLARKLDALDDLVDAAALEALAPGELQELRAAAKAEFGRERLRGRPAGALQETRLAYVKRRARERFALPRVGGD
jgi:hypothetical protein